MSLGKKDIIKNISIKAQISSKVGNIILNKFLRIISEQSWKSDVKISNFGTFYVHKSPRRIGRNPLTMQRFSIKERSKIAFKSSKKTKNLVN